MIKKIAHVGITVEDLEKGIEFYKSLGFSEVKRFEESDPQLKAAFLDKEGMGLEVFEFADREDFKAKIIQNHTGLISDNLESDLKIFEQNGFAIAIPIRNGVTVKRYVFLKDTIGNVFELIEL
jgi:catechol 2,3-dioxygenase-like lactoylglutathione lyase family enzyme